MRQAFAFALTTVLLLVLPIAAAAQTQGQVMAPLQVERKRDGRRLFQAFLDACSFDQHFPPDFFTKASLEKKYEESFSKKDREKAAKQREKEARDN